MLIIFSVLEFLFLGGFLAIIPAIFVSQYRLALKSGDYVTSPAKLKTTKTALIIIAAVALVIYILYFVLVLLNM